MGVGVWGGLCEFAPPPPPPPQAKTTLKKSQPY